MEMVHGGSESTSRRALMRPDWQAMTEWTYMLASPDVSSMSALMSASKKSLLKKSAGSWHGSWTRIS